MDQKYPQNTNLIASLMINPKVQAETLNFSFETTLRLINKEDLFKVLQASTYNEELFIDLTINRAGFDKIKILLSHLELLSSENLHILISKNILGSLRVQQDHKVRELLMTHFEEMFSNESIMELLSNIHLRSPAYATIDIWEKYALKNSVDSWHEVFFSFDPRWKLVQKFLTFKTKKGVVKIKRLFKDFFDIIYDFNLTNDHKIFKAFHHLNSSEAMKLFAEKFLLRSLSKVELVTAIEIINIVKHQLGDKEFRYILNYGKSCLLTSAVFRAPDSNFEILKTLEHTCLKVLTDQEFRFLMWNKNYSKDLEVFLKLEGGGVSPLISCITWLVPLSALIEMPFLSKAIGFPQPKNLGSGFLSKIKKNYQALGTYNIVLTVSCLVMMYLIIFILI